MGLGIRRGGRNLRQGETMAYEPNGTAVADVAIPLERDLFMRTLVRELAGALEAVVGLEEASGYISIVGSAMGEHINSLYRDALQVPALTREQVRDVLVDLKHRIQGDFFVVEETEEKIVFGNRRCPFGDKVIGRPSMCMMTSNVFGYIAAENLGYGKVALQRTIAAGHSECSVVVYLTPLAGTSLTQGREYVRSVEPDVG